MAQPYDLREVPIEALTEQQIKSRMHLLRDAEREIQEELTSIDKMLVALSTQLQKLQEGK